MARPLVLVVALAAAVPWLVAWPTDWLLAELDNHVVDIAVVFVAAIAIATRARGHRHAGAAVTVIAVAVTVTVTAMAVVVIIIVTLAGAHVQADSACTCELAVADRVAEAVCPGVALAWPVGVGAIGVLGEGAFAGVGDAQGQAVWTCPVSTDSLEILDLLGIFHQIDVGVVIV